MKKQTYFVVGLFFLSSFAALGMGEKAVVNETTINVQEVLIEKKTISLQFLEPDIIKSETYIELNVEGASAHIAHAGKPMLPFHTVKWELPFGTKILDIECATQGGTSTVLTDKVIPCPNPVISGMEDTTVEYEMDEAIYKSEDLYPDNWFSYHVGVGRNADYEHATFLTVRAYPARYSPTTNTIHYVENVDITVTYEKPLTSPFPLNGEYDLVVIAPSAFSSDLQKLITHKSDKGVPTTFKSVEDIYDEYSGVDKPEKIKYFIKDALETWDIKYVLLVGGMKSLLFGDGGRDDRNQGTESWHVPARYTNFRDDGSVYDPGFISDLYYADIYKEGGVFDDWDSNDDGIFAKWDNTPGKDDLDLYPDVAVGRLACRNKFEVKIMVNKIVNYEKEPAPSEWFDKILAFAGDSHDDLDGYNFYEGELVTDKIIDTYMTEFTPVKLYASNRDSDPTLTPTPENIIRELGSRTEGGGGHLVLDGHANPASWTTHYPFDTGGEWTGGINIFNFWKLWNGDKLPVVVVGGCHSNQFNVSLLWCMSDGDNTKHSWTYGMPVPECWSWHIVRKIGGGAIASIGNTGLGYGWVGGYDDLNGDGIAEPVCIEGLGGYLQILFYKTLDEETDILGEAWTGGITKYQDAFPGMDFRTDAKTILQWALLGDPSLKIGG